jgi:hypothetical protein
MPLPNEAETLLLQAALLECEPALKAFSVWRSSIDFEGLNYGSQRVLAMLHQNLRAHGVEDPLIGRLRGIARHVWFSNQSLMVAMRPLLAEFKQAGISFVFLKGMALVASLPSQLALRPMLDVDILVHPADAVAAIDLLKRIGWRPFYGTTGFVKHEVLEKLDGYGFEKESRLSLDLHWRLLKLSRWPGVDDKLWSRVMPARIGDTPCSTPSFEDQFLHACVHGAPWETHGTLRWAADCVTILREKGEGFDWDYLVSQARERRVVAPVGSCVRYLREKLEAPVPVAALSGLRASKARRVEWHDYRLRGSDPAARSAREVSFLQFQNWRRASREMTWGSTSRAFLAWLRDSWAVDSNYSAAAMIILKRSGRPAWLRRLIHLTSGTAGATLKRRSLPCISDGLLDLSLSGNPKGGLLYGWSDPERTGRWTDSGEAAIALDLGDENPGKLKISLSLAGFGLRHEQRPHVEIWANGIRLPDWQFNEADHVPRLLVLEIPSAALARRHLVLSFVIRDPCSPKSLGVSADARQLGIFVERIKFETGSDSQKSASGSVQEIRGA